MTQANGATQRDPASPIVGVFDSGVGGLTVVAALRALMPGLLVRYLADSAYFPYGDRGDDVVAVRAEAMTARLVAEGCALVVVACNTASSAALERLRARFAVPIVGMEPPLKPAAERSRSGRVVVLATPATTRGERLQRLTRAHGGAAEVETIPMPGLAALVEAGEIEGPRIEAALREALDRPLSQGVDEIALGCTHYGFLRPALERMLPAGVEVLDAAEPVSRRVRQVLVEHGLMPVDTSHGTGEPVVCNSTGDVSRFQESIERLRASGAKLPALCIDL